MRWLVAISIAIAALYVVGSVVFALAFPGRRADMAADLVDRARKVQSSLVFPADPRNGPVELPTFAALCDQVRQLAAQHGPVTLTLRTCAYPGFDPFPAVAVTRADGFTIAHLADRWADETDARLALGVLAKAGRVGSADPAGSATAAQQRSAAA